MNGCAAPAAWNKFALSAAPPATARLDGKLE